MSRPNVLCSLVLLAGIASGANAGGPSGALRNTELQPVILSTYADQGEHRLFIVGANFGQAPATVTLGGQTLTVLKSSTTEIVARLPADLSASTYLLRINTASGTGRADPVGFPVTIAVADTSSVRQ